MQSKRRCISEIGHKDMTQELFDLNSKQLKVDRNLPFSCVS